MASNPIPPFEEIRWSSFKRGWIPGDDEINGRKDGLLRMDNLWLNEQGALELVRGTQKINAAAFSNTNLPYCYSRYINGVKYRYVHSGTSIIRSAANFTTDATTVLTSGDSHSAYGAGFGQIFLTSGTQKKKDDGTTVRNWGINAPAAAPTFATNSSPVLAFADTAATWTCPQGTSLSVPAAGQVQATADATTFVEILQDSFATSKDTTALSGSVVGASTDNFTCAIQVGDSTQLLLVRVILPLVTPGAGVNTVSDYFWFEWPVGDYTGFNLGLSQWSTLLTTRADFQRVGTNNALGWQNVAGIQVVFVCTGAITNSIAAPSITFTGGNVTGLVQYIQTNCYNNGNYVGESGPSPATTVISVNNSSVVVTPYVTGIDSQVNLCKFYRIGNTLGTYYFVGSCAPGSTFTDNISDVTALETDLPLNFNLSPISAIPDEILSIVTDYFTRILIFTFKNLYLSPPLNPDSIDQSQTIAIATEVGEVFLWAIKASNSSLLVGTTIDVYEISGTLETQADGTLDYVKRPLGVKQPPISEAVMIESNVLYFIAADGLRQMYYGQAILTQQDLLWTFKGVTRYGVPGVITAGANTCFFRMAAHYGQIWLIVQHVGNSISIIVWDIAGSYLFRVILAPSYIYTEEDGTLIGVFNDGYLRQIDAPTYLLDGAAQQSINARWAFQDGEKPYQRKDTFALKFGCDTGGSSVDVYMGVDGIAPVFLGTISATGWSIVFIQMNVLGFTLGKRFSIQLVDHNGGGVAFFRLTDMVLDVDARPIPLPYLRIAPENFGVAGRKRLAELPLVIDTLGNPVSVTPYLDGVAFPSQSFTTTDETTVSYKFPANTNPVEPGNTQDTFATDIWIAITAGAGNLFEFYQLLPPVFLDKIPDPLNFLRVANSNLGSYSRKRWITIAFIIDTRGLPVSITPYIDNSPQAPQFFTSLQKTTLFYKFEAETYGVDVGLELSGTGFEWYGLDPKGCVTEELPSPTNIRNVPPNNFGIAAPKRVRVLPFVINTYNQLILVSAVVDGVVYPAQNVITKEKGTAYYYFTTDVFGTDFSLQIGGTGLLFEFYEMQKPEIVETLPVGKLFDQIGPFQMDRGGKVQEILLRMIATADVNYNVYTDDVTDSVANAVITVSDGLDMVYAIRLPRGITGSVCRIELSSTAIFYRLSTEVAVQESGKDDGETSIRWRKL